MSETKDALRAAVLRARRSVPAAQRADEANALLRHVDRAVPDGSIVAAYVPVGSEPGSLDLLDALHRRGVRVLLPVTAGRGQPLRWGDYRPGGLVDAAFGLREPGGPHLAATEIACASLVLVPALAVDRTGVRLGRGAGFYDRSLPLADAAARLVAVVRDDEIVDRLPAEPHDVPMTDAVTPGAGLVPLGGGE